MAEPKTKAIDTSGFLKNIKTGAVFRHSDILAARPDMIPCDVRGDTNAVHELDAARIAVAEGRRKTKFLGNQDTGALFNYTDILAERTDMISVNSFKEWEEFKKTGDLAAPPIAAAPAPIPEVTPEPPATPAPTLSRETLTPTGGLLPVAAETETDKGSPLALPNIKGLKAREAKTVLADWAKEHFNQSIDRRPGLPVVVQECQKLIGTQSIEAAAG